MDNKKKITIAICAVAIILAVFVVNLGIQTGKCVKTLKNFEESCSELNVDGMLNCINPTIADPLKLVRVVAPNVNDFLVKVVDQLIGGDGITEQIGVETENTESFVTSMKISPKRMFVGLKKAKVRCRVSFSINGLEMNREFDIKLVKKYGNWYISGFKLIKK